METQFEDQDVIGNAAIMVEACRDAYVRAGLKKEASGLLGLEVTNFESARLAFLTIHSLPANAETAGARRYALEALASAIGFCRLSQAS